MKIFKNILIALFILFIFLMLGSTMLYFKEDSLYTFKECVKISGIVLLLIIVVTGMIGLGFWRLIKDDEETI